MDQNIPLPKPTPNISPLVIILSLVLAITISSLGTYIFLNYQSPPKSQPTPLPEETVHTNTLADGETANWKTFTSNATMLLNLNLKYPPTVKFEHKELFSGTHQFLRFENDNGYMVLETTGCSMIYPNPSLEDNITD